MSYSLFFPCAFFYSHLFSVFGGGLVLHLLSQEELTHMRVACGIGYPHLFSRQSLCCSLEIHQRRMELFGQSLAFCPWASGASSQEGSRSWADLPCATATSWTSCVAELDKVGPCSCIFRHACQRIKWWPKARKRMTSHPSIPSHHPSSLLILKTANLTPLVG